MLKAVIATIMQNISRIAFPVTGTDLDMFTAHQYNF